MEGKETHHVSDFKKEKVHELAEDMKSKTVMVLSIRGLPSAQYQDLKKKLRNQAKIQVAKKSLIDFALDHCGIKELHKLVPFVEDSTALLFSDQDAFEISAILSENKSPAKAKEGDISPMDIEIKAGPTELLPGPDISALSSVGLAPKVEKGKIAIMQDKVIVKEGKRISANVASILAKLDIMPFEVGISPVAAYMEGIVYKDIKIDKEKTMGDLLERFSRVLPFAVEIGYVNAETLDFILGKAGANEKVISRIISGEPDPEPVVAAPVEETQTQEETKPEEPKADASAGLASLFG